MRKQPKTMTKNEQLFKDIEKYSYSIEKKTMNVQASRTYKGDGQLRTVKEGIRLKYEGRYASSWLTRAEISSIDNVAAFRLVLEILSDLQYNNPIWRRRDAKKDGRWSSQNNKALKILERHGILVPFRGTDVYYVFPTKLSCGDPLKVAFAWQENVRLRNIRADMIGAIEIEGLNNPKDKTYIKDVIEEFRKGNTDEEIPSSS